MSSMLHETFGMLYTALIAAAALGLLVSMWKVFEKAGHPGWASLIPIYNLYAMLTIAELPVPFLWLLGIAVPCLAPFIAVVVSIRIANAFGKGFFFGLGLALLPFVFYPILAFDDETQCRGIGRFS